MCSQNTTWQLTKGAVPSQLQEQRRTSMISTSPSDDHQVTFLLHWDKIKNEINLKCPIFLKVSQKRFVWYSHEFLKHPRDISSRRTYILRRPWLLVVPHEHGQPMYSARPMSLKPKMWFTQKQKILMKYMNKHVLTKVAKEIWQRPERSSTASFTDHPLF